MALFTRFFATLGMTLALALPSFAVELTVDQHASLAARLESYDAAVTANDMTGVMGVIPPKVLAGIAANFGFTVDQAVAAAQQQMAEMLKSITIVSFAMDLDGAEIILLADGTPYALIPTETVMDLGEAGGTVKVTSSTLGLLDGDTWYLVRVQDAPQVAILKEVYPAFADVAFPTGSMEPVTE